MSALALELERKAAKLPAFERERLAERLLQPSRAVRLNEVEVAWVEEAERRFADWKNGRTKPVPAVKVFAGIRKGLDRCR